MITHGDPAMARLIDFYTTIDPSTLRQLGRVYAPEASFKDPFNDVQGIDAIERVFARMFEGLTDVRFEFMTATRERDDGFLVWDMTFRLRSSPHTTRRIHGASHVRFDDAGKVLRHRDYWDVGEEVYEKIPVLGAIVRFVRRRIG